MVSMSCACATLELKRTALVKITSRYRRASNEVGSSDTAAQMDTEALPQVDMSMRVLSSVMPWGVGRLKYTQTKR